MNRRSFLAAIIAAPFIPSSGFGATTKSDRDEIRLTYQLLKRAGCDDATLKYAMRDGVARAFGVPLSMISEGDGTSYTSFRQRQAAEFLESLSTVDTARR